jgi:hypothetical protein
MLRANCQCDMQQMSVNLLNRSPKKHFETRLDRPFFYGPVVIQDIDSTTDSINGHADLSSASGWVTMP